MWQRESNMSFQHHFEALFDMLTKVQIESIFRFCVLQSFKSIKAILNPKTGQWLHILPTPFQGKSLCWSHYSLLIKRLDFMTSHVNV